MIRASEFVRGECNALCFVAGMEHVPESVRWVRCFLEADHKLNGIDVHMAPIPRVENFSVLWKDEE